MAKFSQPSHRRRCPQRLSHCRRHSQVKLQAFGFAVRLHPLVIFTVICHYSCCFLLQ